MSNSYISESQRICIFTVDLQLAGFRPQGERQSQKVRLRLADGEIKLVAFFLATEFDGFHSLSLLVESKVS